ncbi:MAG: hypothetical protein HC781_08875 [Leptolyngbyaceae cyanobacterium CSU_1_4]|nr:hypothetical protein [Leptolyngbyaceae cyanobacterium CSU_1_4]
MGSNVSDFGQEPNTDLDISNVAELQISPTRVIRLLLFVIAGLLVLSSLGQISHHVFDRGSVFGLVRLVYVDEEANLPTAYSTFAWMLCSLLAAMIATAKKQGGDRFTQYWRRFSFVFAYLTLDEATSIHELFTGPTRTLFHASGLFYYAWVIPGGIFFLLFALSCFKFVRTLPMKTQVLMMLAGATFVTGAIGMEMIGGWYAEAFGFQADLTYSLIVSVEETLEMLGVLILLYALLSYMSAHTPPFRIRVLSK